MNRRNVCRNFLAGYCHFGRSCWYVHPTEIAFINDGPPPLMSESGIPLVQPMPRVDLNNNLPMDAPYSYRQLMNDRALASYRYTKRNAAAKRAPPKFVLSPAAKPFVPRKLPEPADKTSLFLGTSNEEHEVEDVANWKNLMCPYYEDDGKCEEVNCPLVHGQKCDMCDRYVLHPTNEDFLMAHKQECLAEHEKAMAEAFANQLSAEKQCGICMENIHEQSQRFGILNKCKHSYCLRCIRLWRKTTGNMTKKTTRSCPECRVVSDFVIPSTFWVEDEAEKKTLIDTYIQNTKNKICKYMAKGNVDDCPFGNKCFYLHQLQDGTIAQAGPPRRHRPRRTDNDELASLLNSAIDDFSWLQRVQITLVNEENSATLQMWDLLGYTDDEETAEEEDDYVVGVGEDDWW